ncbi:MAG: CBS domain-containing protein [Pyrinomonadaceae bacterium]
MALVRQILDSKGHDIWYVSPGDSVLSAITIMAEKSIGALLVMEDEKLAGILSERDYARKVVLKGRSSENTPVSEIMTAEVVSATPDQTVQECMTLMTEKRIRHLPVIHGGRVDGILSIGDLVKSIIAEQQFQIEQLENYITA